MNENNILKSEEQTEYDRSAWIDNRMEREENIARLKTAIIMRYCGVVAVCASALIFISIAFWCIKNLVFSS